MNERYFKKFWDETTGEDLTDSWGNSTYYFETDLDYNVIKQIQIFENGKVLKYDGKNLEDEYGALADQKLGMEEFENNQIEVMEFKDLWLNIGQNEIQ